MAAARAVPAQWEAGGAAASKIFPEVLMEILSLAEQDPSVSEIVSWLPAGNSFIIFKPKAFTDILLPRYYPKCQYKSFIRKLNKWGFRYTTKGQERGAHHHELFLRDKPHLCRHMSCNKNQGKGSSSNSSLFAAVSSSTTSGGKKKGGQTNGGYHNRRGTDGRFPPNIKDKKRGIDGRFLPEKEGLKKKNKKKKKKTEKKITSGRPIVLQGNGKDREYEVERVLDQGSKKNGQVVFLIRWKGCSPAFDTWEPRFNLNPAALKDFEERRSREKSGKAAVVSPENQRRSPRSSDEKSGEVHGCTESESHVEVQGGCNDAQGGRYIGGESKIEDSYPTWVEHSEDDGPPSVGNSIRERYETPRVFPFFAGGSDYSDNDDDEREVMVSHQTGWRVKEEEEEEGGGLQYEGDYKGEDRIKREARKAPFFYGGSKGEAECDVEDTLGTQVSRGGDVDCLGCDSEEGATWGLEEDLNDIPVAGDTTRVLPTPSLPPRPRH